MNAQTSSELAAFELRRDSFGHLVFTSESGETHVGVLPVRAFAITAPHEGIALVSADGHELAWIDNLAAAPTEVRALIEEELASREFMPEIRRITHVSGYATPCAWDVNTDRGATRFVLKGEEDIRRLTQTTLIIADASGIQYLIRDRRTLDRQSRKFLDRFL